MTRYLVDYDEVYNFLKDHYKHDRFLGRGAEYATAVTRSTVVTLRRRGFACVSKYEHVRGTALWYDYRLRYLSDGQATDLLIGKRTVLPT